MFGARGIAYVLVARTAVTFKQQSFLIVSVLMAMMSFLFFLYIFFFFVGTLPVFRVHMCKVKMLSETIIDKAPRMRAAPQAGTHREDKNFTRRE